MAYLHNYRLDKRKSRLHQTGIPSANSKTIHTVSESRKTPKLAQNCCRIFLAISFTTSAATLTASATATFAAASTGAFPAVATATICCRWS